MKILLAEDERSLSKASIAVLEKFGYSVTPAYNGEEALEILDREYFDLLLLDIMMPKKDGFEVLTELRNKGNDIKVIMLTAKAEVDDKVSGLENGADDYITKPFDYKELNARIKNAMKNVADSKIYEIGDLVFDARTRMLSSRKNPSACCTLTEEEAAIIKKFAKKDKEPSHMMLPLMGGSSEKLGLYTRYLNNKFESLSSPMSLSQTDGHVTLEGRPC